MIVRSGFGEASLDFAIFDNRRENNRSKDRKPVLVSMFDRSYSNMKALTANAMWRGEIKLGYPEYPRTYTDHDFPVYQAFLNPINMGYERFTHAVLLRSGFNSNYILCGPDEEMLHKVFYDYLMRTFDLPLLRSWMEYILRAAINNRTLVECTEVCADPQGGTKSFSLYGQDIPVKSLRLYRCEIGINWLESTVTRGLEYGEIRISDRKQTPLFFADMDSYFNNYGHTIVSNLRKVVKPLVPLKGRVDELALNGKRLFPQQAAVVNGLVALMKKSNYAILNEGMGTGKVRRSA